MTGALLAIVRTVDRALDEVERYMGTDPAAPYFGDPVRSTLVAIVEHLDTLARDLDKRLRRAPTTVRAALSSAPTIPRRRRGPRGKPAVKSPSRLGRPSKIRKSCNAARRKRTARE